MNRVAWLIGVVGIALGILIGVYLIPQQPSGSKSFFAKYGLLEKTKGPDKAEEILPGRYVIYMPQTGDYVNLGKMLLDTSTGRSWSYDSSKGWIEIGMASFPEDNWKVTLVGSASTRWNEIFKKEDTIHK